MGCVIAVAVASCGGSNKNALTPGTTGTSTTATFAATGEQASAGPVPNYQPTGTLIADNGFRPDKDGLPFQNYGNDGHPQNLDPAAMAQIFGDQVCGSGSGGSCKLSPPAQQWMDQENQSMAGGHCYGFSVTAEQLYKGTVKPDDFGASSTLALPEGAPIQVEIAKGFIQQSLPNIQNQLVTGTPNQILDKLIEALKSKSEYYTIKIFKVDSSGQFTEGHAVTPFAVEDKGGGNMNVLIYDNNYPGKTRFIAFDRNANTWSYTAQTNPNSQLDEYKGDANTKSIGLSPESPGEGQQPCPFCNGQGGGGGASTGSAKGAVGSTLPSKEQYNEIKLESNPAEHAHLLLTDDSGQKLGYDNGKFVSDIPGGQALVTTADQDWLGKQEPTYRIPVGTKVTVTIDGSSLQQPDTENVTLTGPGTDASVDDIKMEQGQKDQLTFDGNGSGFEFKVDPNQGGSPVLNVGFSADSGDYGFAITPQELAGGSDIALNIDQQAGQLKLNTTGTKGNGTYAVGVVRISESGGEQKFVHDHLSLSPDETASLDYSQFTQAGQSIKLDISGNGGSRSEELTPAQ